MTLTVRGAAMGDLAGVVAIEQDSFSDPWSPASFTALFNVPAVFFAVLAQDAEIVGFAVLYVAADQAELANLAIRREARGRGHGSRLLAEVFRVARERGASEMWLEVRASNESALQLYRHFGFDEAGRRQRYYDDPVEDAVVMRCGCLDAQLGAH